MLDEDRWIEENTFLCPRMVRPTRVSPEQCEANRKKPTIYWSAPDIKISSWGLIGIHDFMPFACEGCTEYEDQILGVLFKRMEVKGIMLTKEEIDKTEKAMLMADTLYHAAEMAAISFTTLKYRISKSEKLTKLYLEKFPKKSRIGKTVQKKDEVGRESPAEKRGTEFFDWVHLDKPPAVKITIDIMGIDPKALPSILQVIQGAARP